jgi:transposase InsO family protein
MRRHGIRARCRRRFRTTTDSNHALPLAPNLLARQFTAAAPNQVWLADITYVPTEEGWLYLAVVLDLFARKVVGWAMASTMPQELTLAALRMAITNRRPDPGLLHHADRGSQGGFTRSSQHRGGGVVRWRVGGARIELCGEG